MTKKCAGCGVELQFSNQDKVGYIPENKYKNSNYCMRCFKMTHYGVISLDKAPYKNEDLIKKINEQNIHTFFLTDFINITEEIIHLFKSITNPKTLIVNKCEMLPQFINKNNLINFFYNEYKINDKILLKGNLGSREYEKIYNYLKENNITKCLFVGLSNVGKSTLINDLINLTKCDNNKLTVNKHQNTTLDFINIDLKEFTIIDTPGFIINDYLEIPKSKKIKSYIFQMKKNEQLNLTNDLLINVNNDVNINYFTNFLYEKNIKKNYKQNNHYETEILIPENSDLIINGVGFINFKTKTIIKTNIDKKYLSIRISMFGR